MSSPDRWASTSTSTRPHGNLDAIHAGFSLAKNGAKTNTPDVYKTWLLQNSSWLGRTTPSDDSGHEALAALNGRGSKAYSTSLLAIETTADTGADDPSLTTDETKAGFIPMRNARVAELNQEAGKAGWPVLSDAEDLTLITRIGAILKAVAAHTVNPAPLTLRNRSLSFAEHLTTTMADPTTTEMEKEAHIFELGTTIYCIQIIDIYATMELH